MSRCIAPSGGRAGCTLRGPRSHQKLSLSRLCGCSLWCRALAELFRALPIGRHSPKCRPDSPETWRGKPGPTWAAIPNSLAYSLGRTWGRWESHGKEKVGAQLPPLGRAPTGQLGRGTCAARRWECSSGICILLKSFSGDTSQSR